MNRRFSGSMQRLLKPMPTFPAFFVAREPWQKRGDDCGDNDGSSTSCPTAAATATSGTDHSEPPFRRPSMFAEGCSPPVEAAMDEAHANSLIALLREHIINGHDLSQFSLAPAPAPEEEGSSSCGRAGDSVEGHGHASHQTSQELAASDCSDVLADGESIAHFANDAGLGQQWLGDGEPFVPTEATSVSDATRLGSVLHTAPRMHAHLRDPVQKSPALRRGLCSLFDVEAPLFVHMNTVVCMPNPSGHQGKGEGEGEEEAATFRFVTRSFPG